MREGGIYSKAKLSVSPERRLGFIVADILSGEPNLGDWVFFKPETEQIDEVRPDESGKGDHNIKVPSLTSEQTVRDSNSFILEDESGNKVLDD